MNAMTDEQIRIAVAEKLGTGNLWYLKKRGYYYRPDAAGYTSCKSDAWIVTKEIADKYAYPHDEPVTMHSADLPNYPNDLNACASFEDQFHRNHEEQQLYTFALRQIVYKTKHSGQSIEFAMLNASARQRCLAFLEVKGESK